MSVESFPNAGARPVEVVFFDVGGTILRPNPSVGEVYASRAAEHRFDADPTKLNARFRVAWGNSLSRSRERSFVCNDEVLYGEWFRIVAETFAEDVPEASIRPLFEDLYELFVSPKAWNLVPGARETFTALTERGLRLGVLSNWDKRLPETLEGVGLLGLFDRDLIKISHEVGFEKPHPAMFEAAEKAAGVAPERILHVGDSLEADIGPASARGLKTFWVSDREPPAGGPQPTSRGANFSELSSERWDQLLNG